MSTYIDTSGAFSVVKSTNTFAVTYSRGTSMPVDATGYFNTLSAAATYASSDPVAYEGQIITVRRASASDSNNDGSNDGLYMIKGGQLEKLITTSEMTAAISTGIAGITDIGVQGGLLELNKKLYNADTAYTSSELTYNNTTLNYPQNTSDVLKKGQIYYVDYDIVNTETEDTSTLDYDNDVNLNNKIFNIYSYNYNYSHPMFYPQTKYVWQLLRGFINPTTGIIEIEKGDFIIVNDVSNLTYSNTAITHDRSVHGTGYYRGVAYTSPTASGETPISLQDFVHSRFAVWEKNLTGAVELSDITGATSETATPAHGGSFYVLDYNSGWKRTQVTLPTVTATQIPSYYSLDYTYNDNANTIEWELDNNDNNIGYITFKFQPSTADNIVFSGTGNNIPTFDIYWNGVRQFDTVLSAETINNATVIHSGSTSPYEVVFENVSGVYYITLNVSICVDAFIERYTTPALLDFGTITIKVLSYGPIQKIAAS